MTEYQPSTPDTPALTPTIYVASLADYAVGRLHGSWLAADHAPEELEAATEAMLAESHEPRAEEWAIHESRNFHGLEIGAHESLAVVSRLAVGIVTYGRPYALYAGHLGIHDVTDDGFERSYSGLWPSLEDFARDWVNADHVEEQLRAGAPAELQPYIRFDAAAYARDLRLAGALWAAEDPDGVHVFWRTD